jgi:hypothetical protein
VIVPVVVVREADVELELLPPHPAMASVATTIAAAPDWFGFLDFVGHLRCGRAPGGVKRVGALSRQHHRSPDEQRGQARLRAIICRLSRPVPSRPARISDRTWPACRRRSTARLEDLDEQIGNGPPRTWRRSIEFAPPIKTLPASGTSLTPLSGAAPRSR